MKTSDVILKILEELDLKLDENNPDFTNIKAQSLGISQNRWSFILEMMQDSRLIKGVTFAKGGDNRAPLMTFIDDMKITLNGILYLEENSAVNKVIKAAKLLKDTIPGL